VRPTKAYIASLGTTGVLITSSLMMLAFVSALVAFKAWPGAGLDDAVRGLLVEQRQQPVSVEDVGAPTDRGDTRGSRDTRRSSSGERARSRAGEPKAVERTAPRPTQPAPGGGGQGGDAPADGGPTAQTPVSSPSIPSTPTIGGGGDVGGALGGAGDQLIGSTPQLGAPVAEDPGVPLSGVVETLGGVGTSAP
jgi:hypothetical protein